MFDYGAISSTARQLIDDFGMPMTHIRIDRGDPVPGGGYPNQVLTRTDFIGVRTAPKTQELQAGLYKESQIVILIAGDAVSDVDTKDVIEFGGNWWDIKEVANVAPAETTVLRKIGVRLSSQKPIPPTKQKRT